VLTEPVLTEIPLLQEFLNFLTRGTDPAGAVAADVHAEFNFPGEYFTIDGNAAFKRLRDAVSPEDWVFTVERAEATPTGFVVEGPHAEAGHDGRRTVSRTVSLVTVSDGRISEVRHYCTGPV
jgi:ketosteroid isomerase-like protein